MKTNNRFSTHAQGNSMFPLLHDGDKVEYIKTQFRNIQLNDIVLIYVKGKLITHRVIYKSKTSCITRGDNNAKSDDVIKKGRIFAKVVRFKRKGVWYDIQAAYLAQSALYLHEIQKFETVLQFQKIPHVFLKGVLVSLRFEGAIPKRIYADCDVLVRRGDYKKIEKTFKILGYQLQEKSRSVLRFARFLSRQPTGGLLRNDTEPINIDSKPEVSYMKLVNGVPVVFDVHFEPVFLMTKLGGMNLLYPKNMLIRLGEKIIQRREMKSCKGFYYPLCSPPDQILYLALHIFHHNYTDSVRYQLLDAVIRKSNMSFRTISEKSSPSTLLRVNSANFVSASRPRFLSRSKLLRNDMDELVQTIKKYHLEGYVYGVFILLKKYFKTPLPPSFLRVIRPPSFKFQVTSYKINHTDIFCQDNRVNAGISRFILIFLLSPNPFWKKMFLFLHPEVLHTALKLLISFLSKYHPQYGMNKNALDKKHSTRI